MAAKVFLSYRRDASAGHAGRVKDRLDRELGHDLLFMDVDAIPLGMNFVKVLHEEIAKCGVLLAMIGPNWLDARDEDGNRRLDNPNDFVRIEIAAALQRDIPVIPILLDGARLPKADQLPKDLEELALRNGLDVRHASFHNDVDRLIRGLKQQSGQANAPPASGLPPEDRGKMEEAEARQRGEDESRSEETEAKRLARPEGEHDSAEPLMGIVRTLTGHRQTISCIALARDGNTLASGCSRMIFSPELWIWDIGKEAVRTELAGHTASLSDLAFSPDGTILASGANDSTLRLWSVPDGKPLHTLRGGNSVCFWSVAFSPDGATLAAGTNEPMVRLWRCADGKPLRILEEHTKAVTSLAFSPDGTLLASASFDMEVRIWRVLDWEFWPLGEVHREASVFTKQNVAFSPDGALFAAGAQLWRVSDWKLTGTLEADEFEPEQVITAVFSPDSALLATATGPGFLVQLWRVADKKILHRRRTYSGSLPCLTWSPDGSLLISDNKSIQLCSWMRH
jgi:WD40 repeat protein